MRCTQPPPRKNKPIQSNMLQRCTIIVCLVLAVALGGVTTGLDAAKTTCVFIHGYRWGYTRPTDYWVCPGRARDVHTSLKQRKYRHIRTCMTIPTHISVPSKGVSISLSPQAPCPSLLMYQTLRIPFWMLQRGVHLYCQSPSFRHRLHPHPRSILTQPHQRGPYWIHQCTCGT